MRILRSSASEAAALSILALVVSTSLSLAGSGEGSATVADFLSSYAKVLKIDLPASSTPEQVSAALRATGVKLENGLDTAKPLTQADVVRIGKANGLRLTTQHPAAAFTRSEIDQFFASYAVSLVPTASLDNRSAAGTSTSQSGNTPGANKGKKKGHQSPTEPM